MQEMGGLARRLLHYTAETRLPIGQERKGLDVWDVLERQGFEAMYQRILAYLARARDRMDRLEEAVQVLRRLFTEDDVTALFPTRGQPTEAPWRLALVTIMPYVEDVSDRQAAEAVRGRIDWKYALSLELTDPGFDSTVLSEFRTRLVVGSAEQRLLDAILDSCRERKWLKARGRQRTDSTHVLARVRAVNR